MILCGKGCTRCCDFCIYSIRDIWIDEDGWESDQGPNGCMKHIDYVHQEIAEDNGVCVDFYCFRAKDKKGN